MIVYSANYGGKDNVRIPRVRASWNKDLKFVYFTDQAFESEVWDVVVETKHGNSNRLAKWYKLHPHELFPGEPTIWVDSHICVMKDPTGLFQGWDDMLLQNHPERINIYEEAEVCIQSERDSEAVKKQIIEYKRLGCPKEVGLYRNGILLRKPSDVITELNKAWWQEIEKYSNRDQISLPYVLWANGFSFKSIDSSYFGGAFSRARNRHKFRGSKEL